jgi:hypothetical protein
MLFHSPRIVTDGLVLYLDAANGRSYPGSGTTWSDLSGNGNHFTLTNGPTFNTGNLGSIQFDGVNDSVGVSSIDLSYTDNITLDFFCKLNSYVETNGSIDGILCEFTTNFNSFDDGFYIGIADDSTPSFNDTYPISINIRGNNGYNIYGYDKASVNDLQWHHWTCILDKRRTGLEGESRFYIDSQEKPITTITSYRNDNTNNFGNRPFFLGSRNNSGFFANMEISNFKIYNRALNPEEIEQNFNATRGRFGL